MLSGIGSSIGSDRLAAAVAGPLGEMCVGHSRHRTRTAGGARQRLPEASVDLSGDRETGYPHAPTAPTLARPSTSRAR